MAGCDHSSRYLGVHGSVRMHHYCLRQADCRIVEGSANSAACCVVVSLKLGARHCAVNECRHHLVAKWLTWYNISTPALHLGPRRGT
jgi:hypothetical protein